MRGSIRLLPMLVLFATAGCGSSNLLRSYEFEGRTVAAVTAVPPRPVVFRSFSDAWIDPARPIRSAVRVGTAAVKQAERERAQDRLDSAFQFVDIAGSIAASVLSLSEDYLGYQVVGEPRSADFLFDVRIYEYGIFADSWENATSFVLKGELVLLDNRTKETIWKKGMREREPITESLFGLGVSVGNVLTARQLAALSVEEMAEGIQYLADETARHVSYRLQRDFSRSRRAR